MADVRNPWFTLFLSLLLVGLVENLSYADQLFGLDGYTNELLSIDIETGIGTVIGAGVYEDRDGPGHGKGLAFNPNTNIMYSRSGSYLYTVDLNDGSTTLVGGGTFINIRGLTFDGKYDTLYSVSQGSGLFFEIDPQTGDHDFIGGGGIFTGPRDLSTRSDGTVFVADSMGNIFTADTHSGVLTLVASGLPSFTSIAFDSNDVLYGVIESMRVLGTIDIENATFTPIGSGTLSNYVDGLAFAKSGVSTIVPDSVTTTGGDYVAGAAASLAESDNVDYQLRRADADIQSRTEFEVKSISPTSTPISFEFTLKGAVFARSNVVQTIELFDYDAQSWELVETSNAARSPSPDSVVTATAAGDLSRFVESGTKCIETRIHFQSDSARQRFASNTDQAIWTIGQ